MAVLVLRVGSDGRFDLFQIIDPKRHVGTSTSIASSSMQSELRDQLRALLDYMFEGLGKGVAVAVTIPGIILAAGLIRGRRVRAKGKTA